MLSVSTSGSVKNDSRSRHVDIFFLCSTVCRQVGGTDHSAEGHALQCQHEAGLPSTGHHDGTGALSRTGPHQDIVDIFNQKESFFVRLCR